MKGIRKPRGTLTTGEVARLCDVASRTVVKWIDNGLLRGYRIPGGEDRRVPRDELLRFLKESGMPTLGLLPRGTCRLLAVGLSDPLGPVARCEVVKAATAFEAGLVCSSLVPDIVAVDLSGARYAGLELARAMRRAEVTRSARLVALAADDEADQGGVYAAGFEFVFRCPFQQAELVARLERLAAEVWATG